MSRSHAFERMTTASRAFPRQLWILSGATFVYLVGVWMAFPFATLYMSGRLGISVTTIGLVVGMAALAGLPVQMLGGAMTDRFGRRVMLMVAAGASLILYEGLAFGQTLWQLAVVMVIEAAFGWPLFLIASNAMVADLVPEDRRLRSYGLTRTAMNCGVVLGPILGGLLLRIDSSFRLPFIVGGAFCGAFLLLVALTVRETKPRTQALRSQPEPKTGYLQVFRDHEFLLFSAIAVLTLYCYGQFLTTFPIVLRDVLGVSATNWGMLLAIMGATAVVLQYPLARGMERVNPMSLMAISSALLGLGIGGVAFAPPRWVGLLLLVLVSVGSVLLFPVSSAIVVSFAPADLRGRFMGAWMMVYMAGSALAPILGGLTIDRFGPRRASGVILATGLLAGVLFTLMRNSYELEMNVRAASALVVDTPPGRPL